MKSENRDSPSLSDFERIDSEIAFRIKKMSSGSASATEISEATKLIRERADKMMPGVFQRREKAKIANG
jgi:hypothetical protein